MADEWQEVPANASSLFIRGTEDLTLGYLNSLESKLAAAGALLAALEQVKADVAYTEFEDEKWDAIDAALAQARKAGLAPPVEQTKEGT
jgi:hypothetical protein